MGKAERRARKKARRAEARAEREALARELAARAPHDAWVCQDANCVECWYGAPALAMTRATSVANHPTHERVGARAFDCHLCS